MALNGENDVDKLNGILLATDGSKHSMKAASFAGELARALRVKVEIITVHSDEILNVHLFGAGAFPEGMAAPPVSVEEVKSNVEAGAQKEIIDPTVKALGELKMPVSVHQCWGHAGEIICERARAINCQLIVMGSRGRSTFAKIILGSVATQVLNHADCPVTIVK